MHLWIHGPSCSLHTHERAEFDPLGCQFIAQSKELLHIVIWPNMGSIPTDIKDRSLANRCDFGRIIRITVIAANSHCHHRKGRAGFYLMGTGLKKNLGNIVVVFHDHYR